MTTDDAPINVLFVCTGNVCRTPMAVALFNAAMPGDVAVASSVGLLSDGDPASENSVIAMRERGLDASAHLSRRMTADHVADADLVIAMARVHLREAAVLVPGAFAKTFTLKELVRRASAVGPRGHEQPLDDYLSVLGTNRHVRDLLGDDGVDDVADPMGRPLRHYRDTANELELLIGRLVSLLWPAPVASVPAGLDEGNDA